MSSPVSPTSIDRKTIFMLAHTSIDRGDLREKSLLGQTANKSKDFWLLDAGSIKDVPGLVAELTKDNPLSKLLWQNFSKKNQETLTKPSASNGDGEELKNILATELNKTITGNLLYDKERFAPHKLRTSTLNLAEKEKPSKAEGELLNRLLLEDAFPDKLQNYYTHWLAPKVWLEKQGYIPTVKEVREIAPSVPAWLLIDALCETPENADEQLLAGLMPIIGDEDLFVCENLTKKAWFEEVVKLIAEKHPGESIEDSCFGKALEKYWGKLRKESEGAGGETKTKLNQLAFSALCAARLRLWFDPREQAFYLYRPEKGIWSFLTELEVQRLILDWIINGGVPGVNPTLKFANQVVKHLNVIALYERTEIKIRPVHLAKNMLYLSPTEKPAPFSPAYFSKNRLPVEYDETRQFAASEFRNFLKNSISEDDQELLQLWCGYVLLGVNPQHKVLLIRGVGGSGKSTLTDIIEAIIGADNVATLNVDRLDDRFELAAFRDKTLLLGKDVSFDVLESKAAHTLKALSGDQGIEAELKFDNYRFKLRGPFNIAITSNADLEINLHGDAVAWERRLLVIDFPNPVPANKKKPNFAQSILETEAKGVFNWMLRGCEKVLKMERLDKKFIVSYWQKQRIKRLLNQSDSSDFFIEKCLEASPGNDVATDDLYESYEEFCNQQVFNPIGDKTFYRRIRKPIFRHYQSNHAVLEREATDEDGNPLHDEGGNTITERVKGYKNLAVKSQALWPQPYSESPIFFLSSKLTKEDILDESKLEQALNNATSPLMQHLLKKHIALAKQKPSKQQKSGENNKAASKETEKPDSQKNGRQALLEGLNSFIESQLDYKAIGELIKDIKLGEMTQVFLKEESEFPTDLTRFRRFILEDAFPDAICKLADKGKSAKSKPSPKSSHTPATATPATTTPAAPASATPTPVQSGADKNGGVPVPFPDPPTEEEVPY